MAKVFRFSQNELRFLLKEIHSDEIHQELLKALDDDHVVAKKKYPTGTYAIELGDKTVADLLDELSELLTEIGLDENDEPNSTGLMIESLIDKTNK